MRLTSQLPLEYDQPVDQVDQSINYLVKSVKQNILKPVSLFLRKNSVSLRRWYRQQYFVTTAFKDFRRYTRKNEDIFLGVLIIASILGYGYAVAASEIFITFFLTGYTLAEISGENVLLISAGVSMALAVTVAWLAAFVINIISISIMHGATRKIYKSIKKTLRLGLHLTARTTLAWTLMLAVIAIPVIAIAIACLLYMIVTKPGQYELINVAMVATFVGIVSIGYLLVNYSLMPLIAIFDPGRSLGEAIFRAKEMVLRRGRMFVLSLYILLAAAVAASFGIANFMHNSIGTSKTFMFTLGTVCSVMLFQSVMVAFYRKRRLARTR